MPLYDKPTEMNYLLSGIGNAYFSGLTFAELWDCILVGGTGENIDTAILATIKLKEIQENAHTRNN